jgi:hypothetical protein
MSEVDNVGIRYAENADDIIDYNGNVVDYVPYESPLIQAYVMDWHQEMAEYIKNEIGHNEHLITVSYARFIGDNDNSYNLNSIDVVTRNLYGAEDPEYWHKELKPNWPFKGEIEKTIELLDNPKPMLLSETGALGFEDCEAGVHKQKIYWMSTFSGLVCANEWDTWLHPEYWHYYGDILDFIDNTDFDGENWEPGQRLGLGAWSDMDGDQGRIEMVYLRKGDKTKAMGVLNNRTYNYYTAGTGTGDCNLEPDNADYNSIHNGGLLDEQNNGLVLNNMLNEDYQIEYFDVDGNTLGYSYDNGPNVKVEYPDLVQGIVSFKATLAGGKAAIYAGSDKVNISETVTKSTTFVIYPNPANDFLTIVCPYETAVAEICSMNGQVIIGQTQLYQGPNKVDLSSLVHGVYIIRLQVQGELEYFKIVVN